MSLLAAQLEERLLASIAAGRLVILCGAGLSMGEPSKLPSAAHLASRCFDAYRAINPGLSPALRNNLEALADYFFERGMLPIFIHTLVPWTELVGEPNRGHEAIGDFLLTKAADHSITTNVDWLIERSVERMGGDLVGSLDGAEAVLHEATHAPLLKPHGCGFRDRDNTVWTGRQVTTAPIRDRIESLRNWLAVRLQHKDLLVVGFWSDWVYLLQALETCLGAARPASVTVVDPAPSGTLRDKAPGLWRALQSEGVRFEHIEVSGEAFLDDFREAFSRWYARRVLEMGVPAYEGTFGQACPREWVHANDIAREDLYMLRRDAEGRRIGRPARRRDPSEDAQQFAFFLLALKRVGALREGPFHRLPDRRLVRVLNGAGRWLREVEIEYSQEPATPPEAEVVACVGAIEYGVPGNIVRGEGGLSSVVRPAARGVWLDDAGSRALIGLA